MEVVDANGAWVTPSIVEFDSHLGVESARRNSKVSNLRYVTSRVFTTYQVRPI
jgi:imidazolonepropionase-like amidohydrolase